MYSFEEKKTAVETFLRFDHSYADTIAALGYPKRSTLRLWYLEYLDKGEVAAPKRKRKSKYDAKMKTDAVNYYLEHGKSLGRTVRALGYPSKTALADWVDDLAPGERKMHTCIKVPTLSLAKKIEVVAALESRAGSAAKVAERYEVSRCAPYFWRRQLLSGDNVPEKDTYIKGEAVNARYNELPDDVEELKAIADGLREQVRRLQLELDVRQATLELVKKDPGADPNRLTNREKAQLIDSLRGKWRLCELLLAVNMAKSSYEYASAALNRPESEEHAKARERIAAAFESSGGTYGYRRICAATGIAEWSVREIMREEGLVAASCKKKRKYNSYVGEISQAPENTCLNEDGTHNFSAAVPNELWITDITEFRIKAGKVYLSPILDCFDGMPISWSISTSPNAELANTSLIGACDQLSEGERPRVHNDRGGHYRWPGWISICEEHGLLRSMSRKGYSPDNSRMEGFFGRLKIEFFYGCDWDGVTLDEFMTMLDSYLIWYRNDRLKSDLGYMSPRKYRESLGLAA